MTDSTRKIALYLALVLLMLAVVIVQSLHFSGYAYRQDEAWVIHSGMVRVEQNGLLAHTLGIFGDVVPENFVQDIWVTLFGHHESIVRFLPTLYTLLTLALLFRLGADLLDSETGLYAVFLLGTLAFFQFFAHEARPYAALIMGAVGFQWATLRYVHHRQRVYAVLVVLFGAMTLYQHSFMLYLIMAQGLLLLAIVPFQRGLYLRLLGLFALVGLIYLPRFFVVLNTPHYRGGIDYALQNDPRSLQLVYEQMQIRPEAIGLLLLIVALLTPPPHFIPPMTARFRFNPHWRKWSLLLLPLAILVLAFVVNERLRNVTPRNLIIVLPSLALFVAYGLRMLRWQARVGVMVLVAIPAMTTFTPFVSNAAYDDVAQVVTEHYRPDSRLVIDGWFVWEHVPIVYYLRERTPFQPENDRFFHLFVPGLDDDRGTMPEPPLHFAVDDSDESVAAFGAFIDAAPQIWWIQSNANTYTQPYFDVLADDYILNREAVFEGNRPLVVTEYRRIPADAVESARFGEIGLQSWTVVDGVSVAACQTVMVESWWLTHADLPIDYSMTLVLTDTDGNPITNTDGQPAGIQTQLWTPDRYYLDERELTIPCDTEAGDYLLLTGIYDPENPADSSPVYLTTLTVGE